MRTISFIALTLLAAACSEKADSGGDSATVSPDPVTDFDIALAGDKLPVLLVAGEASVSNSDFALTRYWR